MVDPLRTPPAVPTPAVTRGAGAPAFYRTGSWKLGLWAARHLPRGLASGLGRIAAASYCAAVRSRREIVTRNLIPVMGGDRGRAEAASRELFMEFGTKMADLLRYESGVPVHHLIRNTTGWQHFQAARSRGRGVLLLTPHLGNWEFGAPLLADRGVSLLVITLMEPAPGLTELRQASRARRGIETLVIGGNPFAFIEVIRRLESGATVALLMDRPPAASAVEVLLFGRPFAASIAAAELARATGCALVPTYIPRERNGYTAHILPEIEYGQRALGSRDARRNLTQEIMRAFQPVIQQNPTQWYHFVPIWPKQGTSDAMPARS